MSVAKKLVLRDEEWQMETIPFPDLPAGAVHIAVDAVLMPPHTGDDAFWAGHNAQSPATCYIGWGPATDNLAAMKEDLLAAPQDYADPLVAALSLPAYAIALALASFTPPLTVGVLGQGLLSDLTRNILTYQGFSLEQAEPEADLGLLVDMGSEPGMWARSLPALRAHGTLLLFVPPWSRPASFDFYPQIHRRSLQVISRHWHHQPQALAPELAIHLLPIISRIVSESQWLCPLDLKNTNAQTGVWQWINWTESGATEESDTGPVI
ncbi:MAG: hypothetical protein ABID84_00835 [Chloroflexota bacterium]